MSLSASTLAFLVVLSMCVFHGLAVRTVVKTVYRITPRNYTGLTNLDTGDAAGDAFFGIYELQAPVECNGASGSTHNLLCRNQPILQIPHFNVYEQFELEMDAREGHYAECNPSSVPPHNFECVHFNIGSTGCWYDNSDHPEWATEFADDCDRSECTCDVIEKQAVGSESVAKTFSHFGPNATFPKVCKENGFTGFDGYFPKGIPIGKPTKVSGEGDCCSLCQSKSLCKAYGYDYNTNICTPLAALLSATPHSGAEVGFKDPGDSISRTLGQQTGKLAALLNGTWYSTQAAGECKPGQAIGDGCFWRVKNMTRNVNATCVNNNLIDAAIAERPQCWKACPQPTNMSSACWITCLFDTVAGNSDKHIPPMKRSLLIDAFENSFKTDNPAKGGCPEVPPCPSPCVPPQHSGAVVSTSFQSINPRVSHPVKN